MAILLNAQQIANTLDRMARSIAQWAVARPASSDGVPLAVIGIRSRGDVLAARLVARLKDMGVNDVHEGTLDITMYRDDLAMVGTNATRAVGAVIRDTHIDFDITGKTVVLVDDVLHTGRTVRAAMDALTDLGRPRAIRLAVLVSRTGRELPIQADVYGLHVDRDDCRVEVSLAEYGEPDQVRLIQSAGTSSQTNEPTGDTGP